MDVNADDLELKTLQDLEVALSIIEQFASGKLSANDAWWLMADRFRCISQFPRKTDTTIHL